MAEGLLKTLRIEPLHPKHFTKLDSRIASSELLGLQASLVVDWLAQLEQRFPDLLPSRSPPLFDRPGESASSGGCGGPSLQPTRELLEPCIDPSNWP